MSKTYEMTAKVGKESDAPTATINWEGPETVEEAIERFGGEAILSNAISNFTVTMQGRIRSLIKQGKTQDEIQTALGSMAMGVSMPRSSADPIAAVKAKIGTMTEEQKAALLAELRKMAS